MIPYRPIRLDSPCDGACVHCPERKANATRGNDAAPPDPIPEGTYFSLTGGNPLLWEGLETLAARLRSAGATHIRVRTNGMLLAAPEEVERIVSLGVRVFELKIWGGDASVHDRLAGKPGAFDALIEATRQLATHPLPDADPLGPFVAWEVTVVQENLDQLIPILDLALKEKVQRVLFRCHPDLPLEPSTMHSVVRALDHSLEREICAMTREFPLCLLGEAFPHGEELYSPQWKTDRFDGCEAAGPCALRPNGCAGWPDGVAGALVPHPFDPKTHEGRELAAFLNEPTDSLPESITEEAGHSTH